MTTTGNIGEQDVANVADQTAELANKDSVETLRERLRIIHELSKYVWEDNRKRNCELLRKIHKLSGR